MVTPAESAAAGLPGPLLLYDGSCGLCRGAVRWLLARDRDARLWIAPLQGSTCAALRAAGLAIPQDLGTMVLVEAGRVSCRARAVARAAGYLRGPWRWAAKLCWLPVLPDLLYRLVARYRRLFGGAESCDWSVEARRRVLP